MTKAKLTHVSIDVLIGKTITSITGAAKESDEIDVIVLPTSTSIET